MLITQTIAVTSAILIFIKIMIQFIVQKNGDKITFNDILFGRYLNFGIMFPIRSSNRKYRITCIIANICLALVYLNFIILFIIIYSNRR